MIKFGTDGWRGIIARDFTEENVARVARAHGKVLRSKGLSRVFVGYDRRFGSERFAKVACRALEEEGLEVVLSAGECTTPMVSFAVRYLGFDGGVMITASHNPPEYNGYKIKESFGGSATDSFLREVERSIPDRGGVPEVGEVETLEVREEYIREVMERVEVGILREKSLKIIHDPMHGTSGSLLSDALSQTPSQVTVIRAWRDPLFGGHAPEPVEKNLGPLKEMVRAVQADIGIANDGDGDRIALVDERGEFVNSQILYVLILLHLLKNRGLRDGMVVKTVSTTFLADRICADYGIEIREVPVGFKHVNEVILKEKVIFGGEESGGYGVPSFLPERDGFLSALLVLELMNAEGKSLSAIIEEIHSKYGSVYFRRVDLPADDGKKKLIMSLRENPPDEVGGLKVQKVNTSDGLKLVFENDGWLLMRPSGTEPLIRVYAEAPSKEDLERVIEGGKGILGV